MTLWSHDGFDRRWCSPKGFARGSIRECSVFNAGLGIEDQERVEGEVYSQAKLRELRAQRKKASKAWCAFNQDENLNSHNELNGVIGVDK